MCRLSDVSCLLYLSVIVVIVGLSGVGYRVLTVNCRVPLSLWLLLVPGCRVSGVGCYWLSVSGVAKLFRWPRSGYQRRDLCFSFDKYFYLYTSV
jgi:hypothetical protein